MAIRLVQEDERLVFKTEGATLFYRRPSASKQRYFIKKNTNKRTGVTDWVGVTEDVLNYCILDWKGVTGEKNEDVEFETSLLNKLPQDVTADFMGEIGIADPEESSVKKA